MAPHASVTKAFSHLLMAVRALQSVRLCSSVQQIVSAQAMASANAILGLMCLRTARHVFKLATVRCVHVEFEA